jgi:hypothetical protein
VRVDALDYGAGAGDKRGRGRGVPPPPPDRLKEHIVDGDEALGMLLPAPFGAMESLGLLLPACRETQMTAASAATMMSKLHHV